MSRTDRIAVTSRSFSRHPVLRRELLERYEHVKFNDEGLSLKGDALIAFLDGHERAIIALEKLDASAIERLPGLEIISKYGVGLDNIDKAALRKHSKRLGWRSGVNRRSVAELSLGFMISLFHVVPQANFAVRGGAFQQIVGRQLTGKTVGIIGCGNVGKELVGLLQPFDVKILVHDIVDYSDFYERYGLVAVDLETLMSQSDVVSLHVPFDESTVGLISSTFIEMMKNGALFVNTARGGIVDEGAIKRALIEGRLGGIAFDVFANEPPQDIELLSLPNVLATPHIGGSAEEAILAMGRAAIDGLEENAVP